jgi:hypothetical protein
MDIRLFRDYKLYPKHFSPNVAVAMIGWTYEVNKRKSGINWFTFLYLRIENLHLK